MCGCTDGILGDTDIILNIGFTGGEIRTEDEVIYSTHVDWPKGSREECIKYFGRFSKAELLNMLADFVENAEEG